MRDPMKTIIQLTAAMTAVYVVATGVMTAVLSQERGNQNSPANIQAAKSTEQFLDNLNSAAIR